MLLFGYQQTLDANKLASFIAFSFFSIGQLLMLAYFGNSIESTSDETSTAIYENPWIESDAVYKKNLILVMINVITPIKLMAVKVFDVNLPSFVFVRFLSFNISSTDPNWSLNLSNALQSTVHQNIVVVIQSAEKFKMKKETSASDDSFG